MLLILDFGLSTSSFASMLIRISLSCCLHWVICLIKSVINCCCGFGFGIPCRIRSQVCQAVDVVIVASKSCLHTQYAETRMAHFPCWPTISKYDQHPRSLSWPQPITQLAHASKAIILVPPGWNQPSLYSLLNEMASLCWGYTSLHWF